MLDFSKAFDKVPHERLLYKAEYYGISGSTLQWIREFLSSRNQRVIVDGKSLHTAPVQSGVPHDSVLGPLMLELNTTASVARGHIARFLVPYVRTSTYRHSFFPDSIRIWPNSLPQPLVDSTSLNAFKEKRCRTDDDVQN